MNETRLRITGMHCAGCAQRVDGALRNVRGVYAVAVDLLGESAAVWSEADDGGDRFVSAVRAAGYDAQVVADAAELAAAWASEAGHKQERRRHRRNAIVAVLLAAAIMAVEYLPPPSSWGVDGHGRAVWIVQAALFVLLALSPAASPVLSGGLRAVRHRTGNMDLLISMGVAVAFVGSVYGAAFARRHDFVHFHAAGMILALVCVGRYLEGRAKRRASAAMAALVARAPKSALVRRGGRLVSIPVEQIVEGDVVSVPVHAAIPTDGEVAEGQAVVDESLMTGEPMPVERHAGDRVLGGTLVTEGRLMVRATAVGSRSALGRIVQLVAQAQAGRTRMQRAADRVAAIFTPVVIAVAAFVFAGWLGAGGKAALSEAVRAAIAVLVVACPCALGLATPTVVLVASGLAALRGILVRDAAMLEAMGRVDLIVWDKTGTLTTGRPVVREVRCTDGWTESRLIALAAGAEQLSSHPLAKAIVARARRDGIALNEPAAFESMPGGGVIATIEGVRVGVGSRQFVLSRDSEAAGLNELPTVATEPGDTLVAVAVDGRAAGVIVLADAVRPSSASAVKRLAGLGVESEMLTGDREEAARQIAGQVGIARIRAAVDPAGKVAHIEELRRAGRRVAMVGDGINDAAALAAADVGIAFATGADVASETAGINLIGSTPQLVADAVELARAGLHVIRQNLFWALFYNALMIPLAALGKLPPAVAAAAMMVSSLTVVLNALRLPRLSPRIKLWERPSFADLPALP